MEPAFGLEVQRPGLRTQVRAAGEAAEERAATATGVSGQDRGLQPDCPGRRTHVVLAGILVTAKQQG